MTPDVLIPRPETEMLVDELLAVTPRDGMVIDLGTGSGCIVVAAAVKRPDLRLRALDRSRPALDIARGNARTHGVTDRVEFAEADFADPPGAWFGTGHTVVSNPPYIREADWAELEPEVRDHDPKAALVPGEDGLEAYRALIPQARRLLVSDGSEVPGYRRHRSTGHRIQGTVRPLPWVGVRNPAMPVALRRAGNAGVGRFGLC